jgi:ubiquitin C-terminal hydrolase
MSSESNIPKIGLCGFNNIGNTCYLNSVLQLLIHSNVLLSFLLQGDKNDYDYYLEKATIDSIAQKYRKKNNISDDAQITIKRSQIDQLKQISIIKKIHEIINLIFNKGNSVIVPQGFKEVVDLKIKSFRGFIQQDAHEFLLQVLDNIIEETGIETESVLNNVPEVIKNYKELLTNIKKKLLDTSDINERKNIINYLNNYKLENKDIINKYDGLTYMTKIFKKKYNSLIFNLKSITINNIVCSNCNNIIVNYEDNTILSLPICDTLHNSFLSFTNVEEINNYQCSVCNSQQKVFKSCKIWKPPMLLFIQLKRFKQLQNGRILKDNTFVDIPHEFDISDFYDTSMVDVPKFNKYKLKGFINHHGGLNGGHYTSDCVCINDDSWYHFDDSNVSKYNGNKINISSAYILMYEMNI